MYKSKLLERKKKELPNNMKEKWDKRKSITY